MKYYKDNREYIEALEQNGDLIRIKDEINWDLEAGAIVRKVCEEGAPSPLIENIKDYPGHRFLGAPLATYSRLATVLGLEPSASIPEIAAEYTKRTSGTPIKPKLLNRSQAPCKENILMGDDVDLCKLPAPMVHDGDGGRYLGTWHFIVAKDPETSEINWGMYRTMVYDSKTMVGLVLPFSDMGKMFYGKCVPKGKSLPFAMVLGPDPISAIASCAPSAVPEPEFAGMVMGEPVELVKCETCDLEVPAHAEIIIEGEIIPGVDLLEGPFGEYTGYRSSPRAPRNVYRVKCITHRNNPITTISNMGVPTDEGQLLRSFSLGLELEKLMRSQGIPVTGVYMPPQTTHHIMIVGVKPIYSNIATQIGQLAYGSKLGPWFHMVVVVDDTVDIYNFKEVIHAVSTRCHPKNGIHVWNGVGTPVNPFVNNFERTWSIGAKVLFDCTFPLDWDEKSEKPALVSFKSMYPKEIQESILTRWEGWGYKK